MKKRADEQAEREGEKKDIGFGQPDPQLRAAPLPHGQGPSHRRPRWATPTACSTATSIRSSRPSCAPDGRSAGEGGGEGLGPGRAVTATGTRGEPAPDVAARARARLRLAAAAGALRHRRLHRRSAAAARRRWCDLRVVRVDGQEVAPEIVERWQPVAMERAGRGRPAAASTRWATTSITSASSSSRSSGRACSRSTTCSCTTSLIERTLGARRHRALREWLTFDHGCEGAAVAEPPRWGAYGTACLFALPCHRRLAQSQRGVLVHSAWARARLLERCPTSRCAWCRCRCRCRPRSSRGRGGEASGGWASRRRRRVLGSFGFQTPIKRTEVVIAALARPELRSVHLLVVGAVARELDFESLAREHGVADRVHVVGFLDRADARRRDGRGRPLRQPALPDRRRDLGVAAATARGRAGPTVVSDYAQFADLPRDCVAHVPVGEGEVEAIAATAAALLANRDALGGARPPRPRARPAASTTPGAPPRASSRPATSWLDARRASRPRPCRRRLRR